jgi:hypothetical protein
MSRRYDERAIARAAKTAGPVMPRFSSLSIGLLLLISP